MKTRKTKNLSKKPFVNIIIIFTSILLLSLLLIFSMNFKKKNKLSKVLESNNPNTSNNTIFNDTPSKVKLKTLSDDDYKYCETITDDQRLAFLNMNDYSIEDRIRIYLNNDIDNVGLIYYDIESKENISINSDKEFVAASTYKLTLNLLTYHLASIGELDLNELIEFTQEDYVDGTGILYYLDTIGPYTIQELLDLSLIYSDNIAADMLSRILGGKSHVRSEVYKLLNIDYPSEENIITPNVEFTILNYIYDNKDNLNYAHMLEILTKTDFNDRLDKYLPHQIVAHKIGNYFEYVHDVGIIFDDSPHILIIYTYDIENAEEKIAQISKAFYNTSNS